MVEGEAVGGGKLGHGAVEVGKEEEGVVAEAAGAAGSGEDEAFDGALGGVEEFAIAGEGERAAVTGLAAGFGTSARAARRAALLRLSGVSAVGGVGQVGGEAGAADSGGVVEGGDLEAGVVGEDEEVGCAEGVVDGLGAGVGLEGGPVLGRGGDGGDVGEGFDADGGRGRGGAGEVAELAGIGGGGVEEHGIRVSQRGFVVDQEKTVGFADARPIAMRLRWMRRARFRMTAVNMWGGGVLILLMWQQE